MGRTTAINVHASKLHKEKKTPPAQNVSTEIVNLLSYSNKYAPKASEMVHAIYVIVLLIYVCTS